MLGALVDDAGGEAVRIHCPDEQYDDARARFDRALALVEQELGPDTLEAAPILIRQSNNLEMLRRHAAARAKAERALAIYERRLGPQHPRLAVPLQALAKIAIDAHQPKEAERHLRAALALLQRDLGPRNLDLLRQRTWLAISLSGQGREAEAEPIFAEVLAARRALLGPDHFDVAMAELNLAKFYETYGRFERSRAHAAAARAIWERTLGAGAGQVTDAMAHEAQALAELGRLDDAWNVASEAIARRESLPLGNHFGLVLEVAAAIRSRQGRHADATALLRRSLAVREQAFGQDNEVIARTLASLGGSLIDAGKPAEGVPYLERALAIPDFRGPFRKRAEAVLARARR